VVLVGFMGSGKTEVGEALGRLLGAEVIEVDREIELRAGRDIRDIFAGDGEPAFRRLEKAAIEEASRGSGKVISCGGGAVWSFF